MTRSRSPARATRQGISDASDARAKPVTRRPSTGGKAKTIGRSKEVRRGRQVIRHLRILSALNASRRGLTAKQLLETLEGDCNLRTVYRGLEQLEQWGFGVERDGPRFRLGEHVARWQLPIDADEMVALLLAEQLIGPLLGTEIGAPLLALKKKLLAALSPQQRGYCELLAGYSVATTVGPTTLGDKAPIVAALWDARLKEQLTRIEYRSPGEPLQVRDVAPYGLLLSSGRLYFAGRYPGETLTRTFAVPRIRSVEVLDETFEVDQEFDLEEHAKRAFGVYQGDVYRVAIELEADVAHLASERVYHSSQTVEELEGGRVLMCFEAAGLPEIARWLAGFGGKALALEPEELKRLVCEIHREGLEAVNRETSRKCVVDSRQNERSQSKKQNRGL